jgi:ribosome biogenesis GTPase
MTTPSLDDLGWDDQWASWFAERDGAPARIVRVDRGECDVITTAGAVRVVSDSTRSQGDVAPATGDWVLVGEQGEHGPRIDAVAPRRRTLSRRDPGERADEQVLVANIEQVWIVHGLDRPLPPGRLERLLVLASDSGAEPVVVLTKADLPDVADARGIVAALAPDVVVVETSRVDGRGVGALRSRLPHGATAALIGESGAGKSNLLNLLLGEDVHATGAVRKSDAKGRHTTVARRLQVVSGSGCVVDTPGLRAVGLVASADTLHRVFVDIDDLATQCRFGDCRHDREPGCAVQAAVESGALDPRRVARYRALVAELDEVATREVEREQRKGKRPIPREWDNTRRDTAKRPRR